MEKILRSHAAAFDGFDELVAAYAKEKTRHAIHMGFVEAGEAEAYPPPQAHPLIESCIALVAGAYVPSYELVDSLPVKPGTLRLRKDELLHHVGQDEHAAVTTVLPRGKWRAYDLRYNDIIKADNARADELRKGDPAMEPSKLYDAVIAGRSPEDQAFVSAHDANRAAVERIARHSAALQSDVEDLTEANLHTWKAPPFPEHKL